MQRWTRIAVVTTSLLVASVAQPQDEAARSPFDSELVERAGVSLVLLDVEVTDDQGQPLAGLTLDDFEIQLNGRFREIYSLDDLCSPASRPMLPAEGQLAEPTAGGSESQVEDRPEAALLSDAPAQVVLYLDFAMLGVEGRARAVDEARRWVREVMLPGDRVRVRVAAYSSRAGLRDSGEFTTDRDSVLATIDTYDTDPVLVDPFPGMRWSRMMECRDRCCGYPKDECPVEPPCCVEFARLEVSQATQAFRALSTLLRRLEFHRGRKTLIYFQNSGKFYPSRSYGVDEIRTGDMNLEVDEVAAEANLANVALHVATPIGDSNLGANLADFTGGSYNRGLTDFSTTVAGAGRHSGCFYRLGLRDPGDRGSGVFRAKVWVRGQPLPHRRRVVFLDEVDQWWRQAQDVLQRPEAYQDLDVRVALVPRSATDGRWEVDAQVALSLDTLMLVPGANVERAEWDLGGLLAREDGKAVQELLARTSMSVGGEVAEELGAEGFVLHEHRFPKLRPGSWTLGAFARDRAANLFGAQRVELSLPPPDQPGIVGPLMMQGDERRVSASWPLVDERKTPPSTSGSPRTGLIPATAAPLPAERPLVFSSWLCGAADGLPAEVLRFVTDEDQPIFRFEQPRFKAAGDCWRLNDLVETVALPPGHYRYELRWASLEASAEFQIVENVTDPGEDAPVADPAAEQRLDSLLGRLARVADLYRDNVLRFTCDETVHYQSRGAPVLHRFRYYYVYSGEEDQFLDYRVPWGTPTEDLAAGRIDLGELGLPVYLLRAYSWVFVFHRDNQPLYDYRIDGEERLGDRPALRIRFDPRRPYLDGYNDWFGTVWVDDETAQLLKVEAMRPKDHEAMMHFEASKRPLPPGQPRRRRTFTFTTYETLFDVERNGMRFPGKVTIRSKSYLVGGSRRTARVRESPIFEIGQTYKRYRFFGVRSEQEIRDIVGSK